MIMNNCEYFQQDGAPRYEVKAVKHWLATTGTSYLDHGRVATRISILLKTVSKLKRKVADKAPIS